MNWKFDVIATLSLKLCVYFMTRNYENAFFAPYKRKLAYSIWFWFRFSPSSPCSVSFVHAFAVTLRFLFCYSSRATLNVCNKFIFANKKKGNKHKKHLNEIEWIICSVCGVCVWNGINEFRKFVGIIFPIGFVSVFGIYL